MKQRGLLPGRDDNDNDEWVGVSSATFHSALPCLTEPFGCCGGSARKRNDRHWSSGSERATLIWNLNHKSSKLLERRRTNTITIRKAPRWYGFVRLWVCTLAVALSLSCRGGGVVDAADAAAAAGVLQHRRATHPGSTPWRRMGTPQQQQRRWQQQQISSSSNSSSSSNPSAQPTTTPLPVATPPAAAAPRSIPSTLPTAVPFRDPTTPVPSARPSRRASMAPTTPPSGSPSDALIRFRSSSPSDAPSMLPSAENTITTNATIVVQDGGAMEETESETATLEPVLLVSSSHLERIRRTQEEPPSTADDDDDGGGDDNDDGGSQQTASPTEEPQGDTSEPTTPPMSELDPTEAPIPVDNQGTMSPTNAPILPKATNAPMGMPVLNTLLPTLAPVKQEDLEGDAACSAYPACASLGLIDDCCPGPDGKLLDCCQDTSNPTSTIAQTSAPTTLAPTIPTETGEPTLSPLEMTNEPTTLMPTEQPSPQPFTSAPSPVPVANPTTSKPTRRPSLRPTASPTVTPTAATTLGPNTLIPTSAPSGRPSVSPSPTHSPMPSVAPTLSFEYEKQSLRVNGVRLNFQRQARRLQNLNDTTCYEEWDGKVRERIESEVKNIIPTFETLQVLLLNVSKSSEVNLLSYIFDVLIEIRSPVKDHGVRRYLEGPFDTEIEKKSFTDSLRSTGCAEFTGITSMEIIVPTSEQRSTERGMSTVGLIAGLALATASIVLIGAAFIYVRIRNKGGMYDDSVDNEGSKVAALDDSNNPKDCFEYASEIGGVNTNTDISTLGDPIPPGGNQHNDGDGDQSTIGSVTMEYDFKKAFMDAQSVTDSQLGDSVDGSPRRSGVATLDDPSLTSDIITTTDDHYGSPFGGDEQFDVVAPAGLLGLILESNPEDGRPTVNIIKPTSVLANVVHIGDRVVSVDGQNVSTMRASDVSRLIASKKDNARVLVFVRPSKHSTFRIHEDGDSNE